MKKVIKTVALGATFAALASTAVAADLELNIYGASAQNKFWNTYAQQFLEASVDDGGMGCTGTTVKGYADAAKKLGMTVGQNCAYNDNGKVTIRYTANKSVEGPRAVMGLDPQNNDSCPADQRFQAVLNAAGTAVSTTPECLPVTVGASDVASEAFTQESHGYKNGNYNTSDYNEVLAGQVIPGAAEIGTYANPVVVPFSFFANSTNLPTVNNLTRQQALLLMSGNVANWNQFGPGYPDKKVVLCMRHAGSGTHATLDKAIMRDEPNRGLPTTNQLNVAAANPLPGIMFHESSSDMIKCVEENGRYGTKPDGSAWPTPSTPGTPNAGAIGYADSDATVDTAQGTNGYAADGTEYQLASLSHVKRLKYNGAGEGMNSTNLTTYGYSALKNEIIHGSNEFWAAQWLYINADAPGDGTAARVDFFNRLTAYASSTILPCPGIGCYWLTASELTVSKEDDSAVPHF